MLKTVPLYEGQSDYAGIMRSKIHEVSPEEAKAWLERLHPLQRKVDRAAVSRYAEMMRRGQWKLSPDGIVFDTQRRLVQGQHRLQAVILADRNVLFYVTWDAPEGAFKVLDQGKGRTAANALGIPQQDLQVSNTVLRTGFGPSTYARDIIAIESAYQILKPDIETIRTFRSVSHRKGFAAPFKAAAVISMRTGVSREDVQKVWDPLVSGDFQKFTPIMGNFYERVKDKGGFGYAAVASVRAFCAAMKVFDPKGQSRSRFQITDRDVAEAGRLCRTTLEDEGFPPKP